MKTNIKKVQKGIHHFAESSYQSGQLYKRSNAFQYPHVREANLLPYDTTHKLALTFHNR